MENVKTFGGAFSFFLCRSKNVVFCSQILGTPSLTWPTWRTFGPQVKGAPTFLKKAGTPPPPPSYGVHSTKQRPQSSACVVPPVQQPRSLFS